MWQYPLDRVWKTLSTYPTLGSVAELHRGIAYINPQISDRNQLVSVERRDGFSGVLVNVEDGFEPFFANTRYYLNMDPQIMLYRAYRLPWARPKVIANAYRHSRGPWPLIAIPDRSGLVFYENFHGIWPNDQIPVEVLAAILNGYVANAFVDVREEKRHIRVNTIKSIPIPVLSYGHLESLTRLVLQYQGQRAALERTPTRELAERCRQLLHEINQEVLRLYGLPTEIERELLQHFTKSRESDLSDRIGLNERLSGVLNLEQPEWIEQDPGGLDKDEAKVAGTGVPVWALVAYSRVQGGDLDRVALDYGVPLAAVRAALQYYQQHRAAIDARLEANLAD